MSLLLLVLPCICFFSVSPYFSSKISPQLYNTKFIFCIQIDNEKLYRGIENQPTPVCSSLYMFTSGFQVALKFLKNPNFFRPP